MQFAAVNHRIAWVVTFEGEEEVGACEEDCLGAAVHQVGALGEEVGAFFLGAGTDLFLAFEGHDPGYPMIDGGELHIAALAEAAESDAQ